MYTRRRRQILRGRHSERETLDRLLGAVRAGDSRVLVVRGEPGVGKTVLLEYAIEQAPDCRVLRAAGVQSETELAFAGLHQLCGPLLDRMGCLPSPQRDALEKAFGLTTGDAPDRFLVGLAVLGLVAVAAEQRPLVCIVDDAHWLDRASAQTLAFVARRLAAESVGLVFAVRESGGEQLWARLPELVIKGLADGDARALLSSAIRWRLDERVRDRIVAETRGNPLALLELLRGLTPSQLAGGFGLPDAVALPGRIEESFLRRLAPLPADTQQLLLVAAAERAGEPVLVWRAAERLGIGVEAAEPAAAAGLAEFGARVRFRHPLVRSAVYRVASAAERQAVHRALAEAIDPELDPDRRAWHRAHAAAGPDEGVAEDLERSAGRAQARGGLAAAAAFLEQAVGLTPEPARRALRALDAAQATLQAGAPDAAVGLLATAQAGQLDELQQARVDLLRAQIAFTLNPGADAPSMLLAAARELEPLDAALARETYLDALSAAMFVGRPGSGGGVQEIARAARRTPPPAQPARASDLMLDGLVTLITEGYPRATPMLQRSLRAFRGGDASKEDEIRWLWLACRTATELWDDESRHVLATRHVAVAREAGALTVLPLALNSRIGVHLNAGELAEAAALLEEVQAVTEATGSPLGPYGAVAFAAFRGREDEARALVETGVKDVAPHGEGMGLSVVQAATALLYNGLGHHAEALVAAESVSRHPYEMGVSLWAFIELIEAAARTGDAERAAAALERLAGTTRVSRTDWGLGIEAHSRALLSDGEAAEHLHREAIERLGRTRNRFALARAHLAYGEWLCSARRRTHAREQLRTAHAMFTAMGTEAFAERAARELHASGETAHIRLVETTAQLTAQQARIARLARDGLSNPEIGSRLFISPRTVEYHLSKIFGKLNISSRNQLEIVLAVEPDARPA